MIDLSKALDKINNELLLIVKLHAYGFDKSSLKTLWRYLSNHWQKIKVDAAFSPWTEMIKGVLQKSVLEPIFFKIILNDLFFLLKEKDICSYTDDTTPYGCDQNLDQLISRLERDAILSLTWFESNFTKLNTDKCHILIFKHKYEQVWADIEKNRIWESSNADLLGTAIDNQLKFDRHVSNLSFKANSKLSILTWMIKYLDPQKRRVPIKAFFESQFRYCSLVWIFHKHQLNKRISKPHERVSQLSVATMTIMRRSRNYWNKIELAQYMKIIFNN